MNYLKLFMILLIPVGLSIGIVYYLTRDEDTKAPQIAVVTQNMSVPTGSYANILVNITDESDIYKVYVVIEGKKYEMESIGEDQYNYSFMPKGDVEYEIEAIDELFNRGESRGYKITLTEAVYTNRKFPKFDISFGKVRFINCSIKKLKFWGISNLTIINSTVYDFCYLNLADNYSFVNQTENITQMTTSNLDITNSLIYDWSILFSSDVDIINSTFKEVTSYGILNIENAEIYKLKYYNAIYNATFQNFPGTISNFNLANLKINNSDIQSLVVSSQNNAIIDVVNSSIAIINSTLYKIRMFGDSAIGLSDTTYSEFYGQKYNNISVSCFDNLDPLSGYTISLEKSTGEYYFGEIGQSGRVIFMNVPNGTYDIKARLDSSVALLKDDYVINATKLFELAPVVSVGDSIEVNYIGRYTNGTVFDTSFDDPELQVNYSLYSFTAASGGDGQNVVGFDNAVLGMKLGEEKTVYIPPEDAYGLWTSTKVENRTRSAYEGSYSLEVGSHLPDLNGEYSKGGILLYVGVDYITIDFNHYLANETLVFTITIEEITKSDA